MKLSSILLPAFLACGTLAEDFFRFAPGSLFDKRVSCGHGATCREACGGGATECGPNGYCYDPTLGETCCGDSGYYCSAGKYCAPVVGYCCLNGETAEQCAARLTFSLPPVSATLFSSSSAPSVVSVSSSTPVLESSTPILESSSIYVPPTSPASLAPTISFSNATFTATPTTTGAAQFTGAAVKKDGSFGAFVMGALGLLAAAI